jgi:probable phosphoglycerate mutase
VENEIVLVRHATTADTRAGLFSDHGDALLDEPGRAHAQAIGGRLREWRFGEVLVSPVARAIETAALAGVLDRAERCDAIAEWRYGDLVGRRSRDVRAADPDWSLWSDGAPNGEQPDDVVGRLRPVIARLRAADGDVAVVSHGHLLRALIVGWLSLPLTAAGDLVIDPGSISVLGHRHGRPSLLSLNDCSHLRARPA